MVDRGLEAHGTSGRRHRRPGDGRAREALDGGRRGRCPCCIVSADTLKRLAGDHSLSEAERRSFADTLRIDVELRRLRTQATRLSRVVRLVAPAHVGSGVAVPAITVFDCHQTSTLPGSPVLRPATSRDATIKRVYDCTASVIDF